VIGVGEPDRRSIARILPAIRQTVSGQTALAVRVNAAKQHRLLQRLPEPIGPIGHLARVFRNGRQWEEAMKELRKFGSSPETLSLFAIIIAMTMFGAGIFYEGTLLQEPQQTAQLAFPDPNP
jgi:hypothetical protein